MNKSKKIKNINWFFDNSYSKLPNIFKEHIKPTPVHNPELVIFNGELATDLNLDFSNVSTINLFGNLE